MPEIHTLFDQLPDPVLIIRNHRFVDANTAALTCIGFQDKPQALDLHPADLSPERQPDGEASHDKAERMMAIAEQQGIHRFNWIHQCLDGRLFPAEVTLTPIVWEGQPALFCIWRDMSEQEHQRQLLENMERVAGIGGWELDLSTQLVRWSEQVYRIHELQVGGLIPLDQGISYYAPEAQPIIRAAVEEAIARGTPWDMELPFITAKGRHRWVRAVGRAEFHYGRATRLYGAFYDVTERREAEQALRESERRLRYATDHVRVMIAWVDGQFSYRYVNEASPTNMLCLTAFPTPHDRMLRDGDCLRRPSRPRHPFSDNRVASRGSQMTRRAVGKPCSWPSDGVTTPPAGQPPGPGPSGGHEKHPGLAANAADLCFSAAPMPNSMDDTRTTSSASGSSTSSASQPLPRPNLSWPKRWPVARWISRSP